MRRDPLIGACMALTAIMAALPVVSLAGTAGTSTNARRLPTKSTEVNGVTVDASPRLDARGAVIEVTLDTHERELDLDLAKRATLRIGGRRWPVVSYRGDGPGGHHREGTLRFRDAGAVRGKVRLVIRGLGEPAKFSWVAPA